MKHLQLLLIGLTLIAFTACDVLSPCGTSKEEFLKNYNTFVQEIGEKDLSHDASEWETHDREFKKIIEECHKKYKTEMTTTEEAEFWTNALAYYYYRYGANMIAELDDSSNQLSVIISKNVEQVLENPMVALTKVVGEEKAKEIENLMNDIKVDINKWTKKLEKIFE